MNPVYYTLAAMGGLLALFTAFCSAMSSHPPQVKRTVIILCLATLAWVAAFALARHRVGQLEALKCSTALNVAGVNNK